MEKDNMHHEKHDGKHEKSSCCSSNGFFKKYQNIIILALVVVVVALAALFVRPMSQDNQNAISLEDAKVKAETFIDDNFSDPAFPISIVSIEEEPGTSLYKLTVDVGGGELINSYISNDGKMFFPQAFDIAEIQTQSSQLDDSASPTISEEGFNEGADYTSDKDVVVYFFWGDGCPYCAEQKTAMLEWLSSYGDQIDLKTYEVWNNTSNEPIFQSFAAAYDTTPQGVPMTFIGDEFWVGYSSSMGQEMMEKIDACLESKDCENPGDRVQ